MVVIILDAECKHALCCASQESDNAIPINKLKQRYVSIYIWFSRTTEQRNGISPDAVHNTKAFEEAHYTGALCIICKALDITLAEQASSPLASSNTCLFNDWELAKCELLQAFTYRDNKEKNNFNFSRIRKLPFQNTNSTTCARKRHLISCECTKVKYK